MTTSQDLATLSLDPPVDDAEARAKQAKEDSEELLAGQRWTTLEELGHTMPLGAGDRGFTFRPPTLETARRRGALVPARVEKLPGEFVAYRLAADLATLSGVVVGDDLPSAVQTIRTLPWSSVLYMVFCSMQNARRGSAYVEEDVQCPRAGCGAKQDLRLDIGRMRVRAWEPRAAMPRMDVDLEDGFKFPGESRVKSVLIEPAPWDALFGYGAGELSRPQEMTAAFIARAIVGVDTVPNQATRVAPAILGQMLSHDVSMLDESHMLLSGGPIAMLNAPCRRCKELIFVPINWWAPDFFSGHSPDRRRKRRLRSS